MAAMLLSVWFLSVRWFPVFAPLLVGIACISVSYTIPDGRMRNLRLIGAILVFIGLIYLTGALYLFAGPVTTPAG